MVTVITENVSDKKYMRYLITTNPYKDGFIRIDVTDNYFDKSDYAFVNPDTGEVKSYNDVALNYVANILKKAHMSMYDVAANKRYKLYTEPHSSNVVNVEVTEGYSDTCVTESEPVVETLGRSPITKAILGLEHAIQAVEHTNSFYPDNYRIVHEQATKLTEKLKEVNAFSINLDEVDLLGITKQLQTKLSLLKDIKDYLESDIEEFESAINTVYSIYK